MRLNGDAVRAIRERSGMTITELARLAEVDRTTITRIENGERKGTPAQHKAIAGALKVPMTAIGIEVAA